MEMIKKIKLICNTFFPWKVSLGQLMCFMILFATISGCGYSSKSLYDRNISSIYIPIFDNTTFRRGLEFELTKAVKDEIMNRTSLRIVQKDSADTILHGEIVDVTENVLIQNNVDDIVESRYTISVDVKLVDRRTERTLFEESGLKESAEFIVNRGENINTAAAEDITRLAESIVNHLEENW